MNTSSSVRNSTVVRDDLNTAILKNVITVVLCLSINYVNAMLVSTFLKHEIFKMNPRYILYIHLVINDIILLTLLTLIQVLSYIIYTLNVSFCIVLLLIALSSNMNMPMTLAVMTIECYVAVCFPLRYSQICTVRKTYVVIGVIWTFSALGLVPDLFVALATEKIDFFHTRVFCMRHNVFRQSYLASKEDISNAVLLVIVWLTLFYVYLKILFTAKSASADAKKARNTVLLHSFQLLLTMLTYVNKPIVLGLEALYPQSVLDIRFGVTILVQIMPRLVSPLIYGVRDQLFRKYLQLYIFGTK